MKKILIAMMFFIIIINTFFLGETYAAVESAYDADLAGGAGYDFDFDFDSALSSGESLSDRQVRVVIFRQNGERAIVMDNYNVELVGGKQTINRTVGTKFNSGEKVILFFYMEHSGLASSGQKASFERNSTFARR